MSINSGHYRLTINVVKGRCAREALHHTFNIDIIKCNEIILHYNENKANLRDLRAATGLAILRKLDSNCRFFNPCDLEIIWMTMKNNRAFLPYYVKLCASFHIQWWIQTGVTVRKHSILVKIGDFFVPYDLEIWCIVSKPWVNYNWSYSPESLNLIKSRRFSCPVWPWNLTDDLDKQ